MEVPDQSWPVRAARLVTRSRLCLIGCSLLFTVMRVGGSEHALIHEPPDDGHRAFAGTSISAAAEWGSRKRLSADLRERRGLAMASSVSPSLSSSSLATASAVSASLAMTSEDSPSLPMASADSSAFSPPQMDTKITLLYSPLFNSSQSIVPAFLVHTPSPDFQSANSSYNCGAAIDDIVFHPNGSELYFILEEYCFADERTKLRRFAIRKADIARVRQGIKTMEDHPLLTYWWPYLEGSSPVGSPDFVFRDGVNQNISMAAVNVLDVTKSGDYLVMGATPTIGTQSSLVFMSTANGSRTSSYAPADNFWSVAFNPERTHLYVSDISMPVRILSTPVTASGIPVNAAEWTEVRRFQAGDGMNNISSIQFGGDSFVSDETCLYFTDASYQRVWGINPLTTASTSAVLIAGTGVGGFVDKDGPSSSFHTPADVVATSDGCNVFVTEWSNGVLRWLKLDAPCSPARSVHTVARYAPGLWGMTIRESDEGISLYVGSRSGHVFELKINSSHLQACVPVPSPASLSFPSTSPPCSKSSSTTPFESPSFPAADGGNSSDDSLKLVLSIAVPASAVALLALTVCVTFFVCRARRRGGQSGQARSMTNTTGSAATIGMTSGVAWGDQKVGGGLHPCGVRQFSLVTLSDCTRNFSNSYRIGDSGAFGDVYWGEIDCKEVAIKVMTGALTEGKRSMFLTEVNTLSRLHHANLIKLEGYCDEGDRSILVYPYFPGGSLYARLHKRKEAAVPGKPPLPPLTLEERMCIAWQVAKGIAYLHDGANPSIIHRDIKSSNVLLGDGSGRKLHVVVADFGLATIGERLFGADHKTVMKTSHIGGTFGYMAPEYALNGILSEKMDVYAFGVIVLELLTTRKAVMPAPSGTGWQTLVDWAQPYLGAAYVGPEMRNQILDPCLRSEAASYTLNAMVTEVLAMASKCLTVRPEARPTIGALAGRIGDLLAEASDKKQKG